MKRFPRWSALILWPLILPIPFALLPIGLSALADRHGWDGGPGALNLLGLVPLALGVAGFAWVLAGHFRAAPEGWEAQGLGPAAQPEYVLDSGPYAWARHPLYLAEDLTYLGWAIFLGSVPVALLLAAFVVGHLLIAPWEEQRLLARFPVAYAEYCAAVPRWLPRRPA